MTRHFVLVALLALAGCADTPPAETYTVRGVYLGAVYDSAAASIDHEAIPGVMDAMQMSIRVEDPALLNSLASGDKIRFVLANDGDGYAIRSIEPLPDTTVLVLAARPRATATPGAASPDTTETGNAGTR